MLELKYERPRTLPDVVEMLGVPEARPLAGGSDLIPQLREGRRTSRVVVDLKHVPQLNAIESLSDGGWRLGAAVTVVSMRRHGRLTSEHEPLLDAAGLIGSLQIQSRASLGGNLCNAAPSADGIPLLIALDAIAEIQGRNGRREIPVEHFVTAPGRTVLQSGEFLVSLTLPKRAPRSADRYFRFTPRREMDIAIAGAGVRMDLAEDDTIVTARIVMASVGPTLLRAKKAEAALVGEKPTMKLLTEAGALAATEAQPISDTRGSAQYRRKLVAVLTHRALADCADRLGARLT